MTSNERLMELIAEIEACTDVMLNAIKVDEFDVFEEHLNRREALIEAYNAFKTTCIIDDQFNELIQNEFRKIIKANDVVNDELNRFKKDLELASQDNLKQKNLLNQNRIKADKYNKAGLDVQSGIIFDKKK